VAALLLAAACDSPSTPAVRPEPLPASARLECTADVRAGTFACAPAGAAGGARGNVLLGGQGVNVRLISGNIAVAADTFAFDLAVENLMRTPIGTTDGTTVDPGGVQVFVVDGVHTPGGTGTVVVANPDGVGVFTATNQPYFAYHEIITPGDTSGPKRWKLRFDPGVQTFSFSLLVSAPYPPGTGFVALAIEQPGPGQVVGDSVRVVVRIDSASASINSIVATLGTQSVLLQNNGGAKPSGTLSLAGLPHGNATIRVKATTVFGDSGVKTVTVYHGPLSGLTVTAPVMGTVARPTVRVDADCGGCKSVTAKVYGAPTYLWTTVASGVDGIHADVSLAAFDGSYRLFLLITAIDSASQQTDRIMEIPVESSSRLTPLVSGGDRLVAFDSTHLVVGTENLVEQGLPWQIRSINRQTGADSLLATGPRDSLFNEYRGWRHSSGFVLQKLPNAFYNWRNGVVTSSFQGGFLQIAGDWGATMNFDPGTVYRTNLATGAVETLWSQSTNNARPEIAENGTVVWGANFDYQVYGARAGQGAVKLTTTGTSTAFMLSPITDGVNFAVLTVPQNLPKRLYLYTFEGQLLADLGDVSPWQVGYPVHDDFEARNGWLAFLRPDAGSIRQVWARSPSGEVRQVSFAGSHSVIRGLGRNGEVLYANGGSVYSSHYPYTAAPVRLFSDQPRSSFLRWNGDQLLFFLGRTAFEVSY
jgi:hypothetical protein